VPEHTWEEDDYRTKLRQFETNGIAKPHTADDIQQ